LWCLDDPTKLSSEASRAISSEANQVLVSAATMWEIAIKDSVGKLVVPEMDLRPAIEAAGFEELPVVFTHAIAYFSLATHHRDPFDRMLIAQALT
jgi:PIN domain nuclease of toxin-antitoxin system